MRIRMGLALALAIWPMTAQAIEVPPALRSWLLAYESVPTAAQVRQAGGSDVTGLLDRLVSDAREGSYARQRALSFLGLLADAPSTAVLQRHLRDAEPSLRRTGALAWAMGPAKRGEPGSLQPFDALLGDPDPSVRTAAARGLEFVHDRAAALAKVRQRRQSERHAEVRAALDHATQALTR